MLRQVGILLQFPALLLFLGCGKRVTNEEPRLTNQISVPPATPTPQIEIGPQVPEVSLIPNSDDPLRIVQTTWTDGGSKHGDLIIRVRNISGKAVKYFGLWLNPPPLHQYDLPAFQIDYGLGEGAGNPDNQTAAPILDPDRQAEVRVKNRDLLPYLKWRNPKKKPIDVDPSVWFVEVHYTDGTKWDFSDRLRPPGK
jgi:hypothetical protein